QIGGTYVPAAGLNAALGSILGPLTGGAQGDGLLGITFAVQGPIAGPQVIVNPFSLVAPGIVREIFQMTPEAYKVSPRVDVPASAGPRAKPAGTAPRRATQPSAVKEPKQAPGWSSEVNRTGRSP